MDQFQKFTYIIINYEYLFWTTSVEMYFRSAENITAMWTSSWKKMIYYICDSLKGSIEMLSEETEISCQGWHHSPSFASFSKEKQYKAERDIVCLVKNRNKVKLGATTKKSVQEDYNNLKFPSPNLSCALLTA